MILEREYLWPNFLLSVWLLIVYGLSSFIANMMNAEELSQEFGAFSARVALWPIGVAGIEFLVWLQVFRYRQSGSRILAGTIGILLALSALFVPIAVADLNDQYLVHWGFWVFFLYVSFSHMAYAIAGTEHR